MPGILDCFRSTEGESVEKQSTRTGITIAKVSSIKDPKNYGRVKCTYVTSDKDAGETGWIYCTTSFGGNKYGAFFHPNVGDMVVLAFENGDIHRPFVIGRLWVKTAKPPLTVKDGKNEEYQIITPNKSVIDFIDTKGKEKITINTPKKRIILLDDENQLMKISDGKNTLSVNGKTGATELTCDKTLTIKVGKTITITCDGSKGTLTVDAKKQTNVKSAQISIKASGTAELVGNGQLTVKSSGITTVKGSMTKIN